MDFNDFWKKNFQATFGDLSPYKDIAKASWEAAEKESEVLIEALMKRSEIMNENQDDTKR